MTDERRAPLRFEPPTLAILAGAVALLSAAYVVEPRPSAPPVPTAETRAQVARPCPSGEFPVPGGCAPATDIARAEPLPAPAVNYHVLDDGHARIYDYVPAPPSAGPFAAYAYPVHDVAFAVEAPFDLQLPDPEQVRGRCTSAVGHAGVDLVAGDDPAIVVTRLVGELGPAVVLFAGDLEGPTVVTYHRVLRNRRAIRVVAIHANLGAIAAGITPGIVVVSGTALGQLPPAAPGAPSPAVHYELRLVREGVELGSLEGPRLFDPNATVPVDPRALLLRAP